MSNQSNPAVSSQAAVFPQPSVSFADSTGIITFQISGHTYTMSSDSKDKAMQKKMQEIFNGFKAQFDSGKQEDIVKTIKYIQEAASTPSGGPPPSMSLRI